MAADDFAILTCISRYPNPGFDQLTGPPNDMKLVEGWLVDPSRGGLLPDNIKKIATPDPYPADVDPENFDGDMAPPTADEFDLVFKRLLRKRREMGAARLTGRLYLYFSGHGFCNRSQGRPAEAALYSANATREMYDHIFGTHYARVAVNQALFKEVVLIMDCCRDSEIARVPTPKPYRDTPDDQLAGNVLFLSIYAVPKGGKAQERPIPEREGRVHGLLTHALLKLLDELPSTSNGQLSASDLRQHLLNSWPSICGDDAAPRPEVHLPANGDIFFEAKNLGCHFEFRITNAVDNNVSLTLSDSSLKEVAVFPLDPATNPMFSEGGPVLSYQRLDSVIRLRMRPGLYQFRLSGQEPREDTFKVDGGGSYVNL